MKLTSLHSFLCQVSLFFLCLTAHSQERTKVEARIDRDSIFIGQQITITLQADIPETDPIRFFLLDTINHFEFIQKGKIDTTNTSSGTRLFQQFTITSFDSGQFVIPSFVLDAAAGIKTDSFLVDVSFSPFDPEQAYHKVKDIIEIELEKKQDRRWIFIAAGGVLILLAIYFALKKKKPAPVAIETVNPFEKAMKALDDLDVLVLNTKEYYSRIADIFREYLSETRGIHSMQKTTDDLVVQLKSLGLEKNLFDSVSQSLRLCDFVKFAKYIPEKEDGKRVFEVISSAIKILEEGKRKEP